MRLFFFTHDFIICILRANNKYFNISGCNLSKTAHADVFVVMFGLRCCDDKHKKKQDIETKAHDSIQCIPMEEICLR